MITLLLLALSVSAPESVPESSKPRPLDAQQLLPAMRKALGTQEVQVEIVEVSHFPAPDGEIQFSRNDLTTPVSPHAPARWRGSISYEAGRRFSIWADVRLTASCRRVVAVEPLPQQVPIRAEQLREETYDGFPSEACSWRAAEAVGLVPTRMIAANAPVSREVVVPPPAVHKGDEATAEYRAGGVRLSLTVIVERSGRVGEIIPVLNPSSHKLFQARVSGLGSVEVDGANGLKR